MPISAELAGSLVGVADLLAAAQPRQVPSAEQIRREVTAEVREIAERRTIARMIGGTNTPPYGASAPQNGDLARRVRDRTTRCSPDRSDPRELPALRNPRRHRLQAPASRGLALVSKKRASVPSGQFDLFTSARPVSGPAAQCRC